MLDVSRSCRDGRYRLDRNQPPLAELRRIGQLILSNHLSEHGFAVSSRKPTARDRDSRRPQRSDRRPRIRSGDRPMPRTTTFSIGCGKSDQKSTRSASNQAATSNRPPPQDGRIGAILAMRMLGYTGNYVSEHPSLDRFAETVEKLTEDLRSQAPKPYGKGAPSCACANRSTCGASKAARLSCSSPRSRSDVQAALDEINPSNTSAGSRPF